MKRITIACIVLVVLAVLVAPASANPSPSPVQKVTWRGSGITADSKMIKFDGTVTQSAFGDVDGKCTLVDRAGNLKAAVHLWQGEWNSDTGIYYGYADVTVAGITYRNCDVELILHKTVPEMNLVLMHGDMDVWVYYCTGDAFHGTIRTA